METFSVLLVICAGNSPVTGEFPAQRPVTRSFDVFVYLRLNKQLVNNREGGWWFETLSRPLWRHCNDCSAAGPTETETEMSSGWQLWSSLETFKTSFNVHSDYQGCHPDDLFVSWRSQWSHWGRDKMVSIFAKDIFKSIFLYSEVFCILIQISLKYIPISPMNSNPALV